MGEIGGTKSWTEELASLVEDTGIRFTDDDFEVKKFEFEIPVNESKEPESLKDQIKGFAKAWGEILLELGRGCKDVVRQSFLTEDSYIVKKTRGPLAKVSEQIRFVNEYLPEDRDPAHAWSIIILVFMLAFAVLGVNIKSDSSVPLVKKILVHPPSAIRTLLPDGRYLAYHEFGVPANRARFSVVVPHSFLFSRLSGTQSVVYLIILLQFQGIPGVKMALLEEFGVRLVTYDRPGFGESDPDPGRNLSSSALDMLNLAEAIGIKDKFWILGHSDGAIHAWAALNFIPHKIAGAGMIAPMVNPYDSSMTKEEMSRAWEKWTRRRRWMYHLARRSHKLLNYFYSRKYLSGKHGQIDNWLSLSLGEKDTELIRSPVFEEFWRRNVEESLRQGSMKPFIEEAALQVSDWGFSPNDLRVREKCPSKSFFQWLDFLSGPAECTLTGFLGPIHIWQGTDDLVVSPSVTDFVGRTLPSASIHKLPDEGHFSYFFFCDKCQRHIFTTLFGNPRGPLEVANETSPGHSGEDGEASILDAPIL
ncbi:OLC1v1034631C1 [Oldenlandia corymbosa var. corymbosa]|uniref:OLC1v1034631C1 n=1 Tax=Oldenlandia corymbosa var. corymbosa TaxID=529605 RepID=A0AAV1CSR6_OLDCO|nr:OLC1v1034631C1 [Oldenlandia corymbosa var. corymbosa]